MADQPTFCPWCGKPRPNDASRCPSCGKASIQALLAEGPADPISYFGADVEALLYDEKSRQFFVNPEKTQAKWQWQTAQLNNSFPATIPANQTRKLRIAINPEPGYSGDTEVGALMGTQTGRCAIRVFVPILDKYLSNGLVPSSCFWGTSQLPALLASTIYALPTFDWTADVMDVSGASNSVSLSLFSRRFLEGPSGKKAGAARRAAGMSRFVHPYWLVPTTAWNNTDGVAINPDPFIAIPTGDSVTVTYSVPGDMYFDCKWFLDESSSSTGVEIADLFVQRFKEGGTGRDLVTVPAGSNGLSLRSLVASPTVAVTGFPSGGGALATGGIRAASLPSPAGCWTHLFQPGTDIQITYVSTDAGTITLRNALVGNAIYADLLPEEACA